MPHIKPARSRAAALRMLPIASAFMLLACGAREDEAASSSATSPTASEQERDPLVGYDLRRLRPRDDEPLADSFEQLRKQAVDEGKRVAVLFSADWCEPCRHLDLELGNTHPASMIGDVRILELKEDDWSAVARMDEFNSLRRRWEPVLNTYPLLILLDGEGKRVEEMKDAKDRLEAAGMQSTLPIWFESSRLAHSG